VRQLITVNPFCFYHRRLLKCANGGVYAEYAQFSNGFSAICPIFPSMRIFITTVALIAICFASAESKAGIFSECSPCGEVLCDPCEPVCGKKPQWEYGGWIETGLFVNQYGHRNAYNNGILDPWSGNTTVLDNVRQSDLQVNQTWLYFGRQVNTRRGFDVGGRIDFVYGTDAASLQSEGLEADKGWNKGDYYAALPQLYGEVGYNNLNVKVGKFLTPMGHEDSQALERFFYSLGYTSHLLPNMHSGVVTTWTPTETFTFFGGWLTGETGFFNNADDNAALFGATIAPTQRLAIVYSALIGREKSEQEYFAQSLALTLKPAHRWEYTLEWTLRNDSNLRDSENYGGYGINNELIYRANSNWALGTRIEWMRFYDNSGNNSDFPNTNLYGCTFGLNWTPNQWLLVRPEVRYDKVFGFDPFKGKTKDEQLSGGASVVVKF
jgi:hypothetical protein